MILDKAVAMAVPMVFAMAVARSMVMTMNCALPARESSEFRPPC